MKNEKTARVRIYFAIGPSLFYSIVFSMDEGILNNKSCCDDDQKNKKNQDNSYVTTHSITYTTTCSITNCSHVYSFPSMFFHYVVSICTVHSA